MSTIPLRSAVGQTFLLHRVDCNTYTRLGVPISESARVLQVGRRAGGALTFKVLEGGAYATTSHSKALPILAPAELMSFLALLASQDENSILRQFRAWLRQGLPGAAPPGP